MRDRQAAPRPTARRARATRGTAARATYALRRDPCAFRARHRARWSPKQKLLVADRGREVVCPCGVCGRVGIADGVAQEREHLECAHAERVVVEIVGELERCTCVLERADEALREARRPRKLAVDARAKRGPRAGLAQRLLEQRDGPAEALELGQQTESLRAQRADAALSQELARDCPRARPLTRGAMGTRCS